MSYLLAVPSPPSPGAGVPRGPAVSAGLSLELLLAASRLARAGDVVGEVTQGHVEGMGWALCEGEGKQRGRKVIKNVGNTTEIEGIWKKEKRKRQEDRFIKAEERTEEGKLARRIKRRKRKKIL